MWSAATHQLLQLACDEDLGPRGDITSILLPGGAAPVAARVAARQPGVVCGLALAPSILDVFAQRLSTAFSFAATHKDGDAVQPGDCVATVSGPRAHVLAAECTLLNFLARLSGIATLTRRYVRAAHAANPLVQVLDTRKTVPGWRELDKYAVRCGGGHNHRHGLHDAVLIKDNHLAGIPVEHLAATLTQWLARVPRPVSFVEVEVDNLAQLAEVCRVPGVDMVLLDNFTPDQMRAAVAQRDAQGLRGKLALEASGGVSLDNIAAIAATGVERVSVGALTQTARGLDFALDL